MPSFNIDAIPQAFRERDRWLLYDTANDTARQPHWDGDYSISWSESSDRHTFTEAVRQAREQDSWGIGYVVQPNDDIVILDIDDPFTDDGHTRDWLPSLDCFRDADAYMERSPSGNGIHIPVEGDVPEWWRDSELDADKHQGVEVLNNKFCTFTGDTLPDSGDKVPEINPAPFLFNAYQNIRGESPRLSTDSDNSKQYGSDEWLTDSLAKDALDAINPDLPHNEWIKIGYAVHAYDSGSTGKSLFESWSSTGNKWDEAAERSAESIWQNATQGSDVTVGTLIHAAKEQGWQPPTPQLRGGDSSQADSDAQEGDDSNMWGYVRGMYGDHVNEGRLAATNALERETNWMYVIESERLWVYDDDKGYFNPRGDAYARNRLEAELHSKYKKKEANEVIERLEARNQTRRKKLNARTRKDPLLCVGNGVVNLRTSELVDHSPKYKFTRGLQWDHDTTNADPESVIEFLDDVTRRTEDRDTLVDHLAHGLMPGHPFRAFVMMYGPGSNGKTRVGKLFRLFVGEENAASVELQDLTGEDQFATGALPGAYINIGDDVSVGELRNTSILKSLTGGGTMRANEKFEKKFDFENQAAMFFSANEPPRFAEQSIAIADRLYPIEMPYRFVPNPDGPFEKQKETGIAERIAENEDAMRGLLQLVVEHAQQLLERDGEYSMPETPEERRELYEAASDPVKRFALEYLQEGDGSDYIIKDDAYAAYKEMCDRQNERVKSEDIFKRAITQMASVNVETSQPRSLTPGDSRDTAWKYVTFADSATDILPARLTDRYFDGESPTVAEDNTEDMVDDSINARAIQAAATSSTGYVTVTAEVLKVTQPDGDNSPELRATVKDETSAIDAIAWDDETALEEGETVMIDNAELSEYDNSTQLVIQERVTSIKQIQPGIGFAEGQATQPGQQSLGGATDGGGFVTVKDKIEHYINTACDTGDELTIPNIAGQFDANPDNVRTALNAIQSETSLLAVGKTEPWEVLK